MIVKLINDRPVKIWTDYVEASAMVQIENLARLPFMYHHLAVMPDVHTGMGMPIGGVLACVDAVIPNAVGVDIGCGMCAVKTSIKTADIDYLEFRKRVLSKVREIIPLGMSHHKQPQDESLMPTGYDVDLMWVVKEQYQSALRQVGTLGGGNHFIEFQRDEEDNLWIMIHSGSRNLGKMVGDYYNKKAMALNKKWHSEVDPSMRLAFLPFHSPEFGEYWREMQYCIDFALCNRKLMMSRIQDVLESVFPQIEFEPMINIAHNYAAWETHFGKNVVVHRKGATFAGKGTIGIIPGSQGTASYIVVGLGNPESFNSCSHGAGRVLSRTAAINQLEMETEVQRLNERGIIHAIRNKSDLQEAPSAYKDIDEVINNQLDLIAVKTRLLPIAVIKG